MGGRKFFLIQLVFVIVVFFLVHFGFAQTKRDENVFFSGKITRISGDYRFIVVNEMNIMINSDTKLLNEKSKSLKVSDLKPGLYVRIEGVQNPNGCLAKKIVVKKAPEV